MRRNYDGLGEYIIHGISIIVTSITDAISEAINNKRVKKRMEPLDYAEYNQKRKRNYTRSLIVDEQILMKIKEEDAFFDDIAFKEWVKETFIELQKAWTNKEINQIRSRLDKNLCEHYQLILNSNVAEDCINIVDIKQINYVDFSAYSVDDEKENIEVAMNVVITDYTIDKATEKIVSGSEKVKIRTTYKLDFYRKHGTKSDVQDVKVSCPNCGAELDRKENRCHYCKTWILNGMKEWLLNSIEKY